MLHTNSYASHYEPMANNDVPEVRPERTPEAKLAGFIKRNTKHIYKSNVNALGPVVSDKIF